MGLFEGTVFEGPKIVRERNRWRASIVAGLALALAGSGPAPAQDSAAHDAAERLIAQERARATVEAAFGLVQEPEQDGRQTVENFNRAGAMLLEAGHSVVPFLANELDQALEPTFFLCAYALGLFDVPEAEVALRRAIERAEREHGDYPFVRKAYAAFGLGLMGRADALDLVGEGRHQSGSYQLHEGTSTLEAIAIQTAPACVPQLVAQLERYRGDETLAPQRIYTLRALGRVGDPASAAPLLALLGDSNPLIRREATRALGFIDAEGAVAGLIRTLGDDDERVRRAAGAALLEQRSAASLSPALARLEVEDSPVVRGFLYELVVHLEGAGAVERLRPYAWRPDPDDRFHLVRALAARPDLAMLPLVRDALRDADPRVPPPAIEVAARLATPESTELLSRAIAGGRWTLAAQAVEAATAHHLVAAAPAVAERLVGVELAAGPVAPETRSRVRLLGSALLEFGFTKRNDEIAAAAEAQTDPVAREDLAGLVSRLELLRANGTKSRRWVEALGSDLPEVRLLAIRRLGTDGGERAARGLTEAFGRAEPPEALEILRQLGGLDAPESRALIRRVLLEPAFDAVPLLELRDMAAWSARRLGGQDLYAALEQAVLRREGREAKPLVYLAVLGGEAALPALEQVRVPRMRTFKWTRGNEQRVLRRLLRRIRAGSPIDEFDVPPDRISLRYL